MKKKALLSLLTLVLAISMLSAQVLAVGAGTPVNNQTAASGTKSPIPSFEDVASNAWYYNAVQYSVQKGLMTGISNKSFAPEKTVTRAMLASILYYLDGSKKTDKSVNFTDVPTSSLYYDAVNWAVVNNIALNYSGNTFGAGDNITRQEIAVMFHRYAKYKGRSVDFAADLSSYKDVSAVESWASDAMGWAIFSGLITGTDSKTLSPRSLVTRAQAAAFLMRYMNGSDLEKRTSDYVSEFIKGNFDNFYKASGPEFNKAITMEQLVNGFKVLVGKSGKPGKYLGCIYQKLDGIDYVACFAEGIRYNLRILIGYGRDGKPITMFTSAVPLNHEPQSTEKWEEVPVKVGKMGLSGMLTLPKGVEKPPVVILVQGSGASDMNEAGGSAPNKPFMDIAHGLAEQGVATLRYNKPTYQFAVECNAEIIKNQFTIQDEVLDDAAAAVKLLSSDSRVDTDRIYLLGHSLGGVMAPKITADNPKLKGFISMAGSLRRLNEIVFDQFKAVIQGDASLTEQQKKDVLLKAEPEYKKAETLDDGGTGFILDMPTSYWKSYNAIDNTAVVKNLNVPILILQGSADFQIYADKDYKLWQTTLAGRDNVTFKLYDGLSHMFMPNQISENGVPDTKYYDAPNHVDKQVITDIASWVNKQ